MARTVRTAGQQIRRENTVISVVSRYDVVLEVLESGSGGLESISSGCVSISERAVSRPKRTSERKVSILSSLLGQSGR